MAKNVEGGRNRRKHTVSAFHPPPYSPGRYIPRPETAHPSYLRLSAVLGILITTQLLYPGFVALNTIWVTWVLLKMKAVHNTIKQNYLNVVRTSTAARAVGRKYPRDWMAAQE